MGLHLGGNLSCAVKCESGLGRIVKGFSSAEFVGIFKVLRMEEKVFDRLGLSFPPGGVLLS